MIARAELASVVLDRACRAALWAVRQHPRVRRARQSVDVTRDVPYADDGEPSHRLDIYRPRGAVPEGGYPIAIYIHGGAFQLLSKDTHEPMALGFARRGFLVFNIDYRLAPKHRFPAAIDDVCAAYAWVVRHAREYGGALERLVVAGESAGANLATALAVATSYRRSEPYARAVFDLDVRPAAVLPACGMLQTSDAGRFRRRRRMPFYLTDLLEHTGRQYLGDSPPKDGALDLADPLVVLERGAPPDRPLPRFFAAVGTKDPLLDDTRRLGVALERLGVPCEVRYYADEIHAFHALIWRASALACWREKHAFIASCWPAA